MRIFQCVSITALLVVASSSQYVPGGYFPPRRQVSDSALHKFLSAVRGGGRGHRELLTLTGSASNPYNTYQSAPPSSGFGLPFFGVGRLPPSINHISAPPKIGAFYITPPERNAPFYYSSNGVAGKKPQLVKITELKNAQPLQIVPAESSNRPRQPHLQSQSLNPFVQMIYTGPGPVASSSNGNPQGVHGGVSISQGGQPQQGNAGSLQEIIAKAAQEQHALVIQKEQKAHPNAQINSHILVPGAAGPGQQPVFLNQFGQPFLAPAILAPGQAGQPQNLPSQFLAGNNGQGGILIGQGPGPVPPQALLQQLRQPQNIASLNSITSENPEQLLKVQQQAGSQQQQQIAQLQQIQFLNSGIQFGPQGQPIQFIQGGPPGQRIPISLRGQQIPHGAQIFGVQQGAPHIVPSQFAVLPPGLRGPEGQFIPSNAILGQPQFTLIGGNGQDSKGLSTSGSTLPGGPQGQTLEKEEQPTRPHEAASQNIPSVAPLSSANHGAQSQMTAAIMQSQLEFSEPIVKLK